MILIKIIIAVCLTVAAGTTIEAIIPDEPKAIIEEVQEIPVVEEVKEEENLVTKEITISILEPITVKEKVFELQVYNHDCTQFEFIEHPELYVSRGKVKVTVSGPAELINSLPDSVLEGDALDFPIRPFIEVNDFTMGEHTTFLNITSEIPEIKVSPSSIKVKYEVRRKGDIPICVVGDV